ncbi:lipopolysaccharide-assembly, LptC-related [bacterium BMS3Abin09]|nr:lipopolysaccharide-assembly, LptC-related [bacterium BMS3Abin09]GBE41165.1 lipopolysaccharide-assembly, LptC-related [bacterium BMS3Bbin09]
MIKSRLFLILACVLVLGTLIILNYSGNSLKIKPSYKMSYMHKVHMINKEGDSVKWELSAEKALFPKGNKEIFLNSLGLTIKNTTEIYLTSKSGIYTVENGNMTLNDPVELNVKDAKFMTAGMHWNSREETLTTDNDIEFIGKNFNIVGKGLIAKTKEQKIRILKDVKAIFYL